MQAFYYPIRNILFLLSLYGFISITAVQSNVSFLAELLPSLNNNNNVNEKLIPETATEEAFAFNQNNFISALDRISNHILKNSTLTGTQITSQQTIIKNNVKLLANNTTVISESLALVKLFETEVGPLFVKGPTSISRAGSGRELEKFMLYLQQSILDYSYTEENLLANSSLFNNVKFETSSYFPGAVNPPSNSNVSYTVKINGNHIKNSGAPANYETEDARRPTGCYLAPGSIARVTVPASLVGIGASVLVGAHTWDNTVKPNIKRMDRVSKLYKITSQTITVANPLGGGIYINVPFESSLGIINVTIQNVVRSPYYANTAANKTSVSNWQNVQRKHTAPWADFETDKVMHQVPTSWIYNVNDPSKVMQDWDLAMDGISEMLGRPLVRSKTVVYQQVDLQLRGSAFFPGYPQANITYNPKTKYGGNHNHFLVRGPRDRSHKNQLDVFFHELGHAEKVYKFVGEIEAFVNFLYVGVYNKKFGVDLNTSFIESSTTHNHTIDEAAISWMITENFRLGNQMSSTTGQFRQEFSYQPRGYAKYADIVQLFGWKAIEKFYQTLNADYDAGTYESANRNVNLVPTDSRVLRMSVAAGYDLRPLIHFWGKHPDNFNGLANSIQKSGVQQSAEIYDKLQYYKTIVPKNNAAFRSFGLKDFSQSRISNASLANQNNISQSYTDSFFRKFWNSYKEKQAQAAVNEIQNIIELYFPDGRPQEGNTFTPDPNKTYYIDSKVHNLRLATNGSSEEPYTTSTTTTGEDVRWKFVAKSNGNWHIQRAAGGTKPRLRSDGSEFADMQGTSFSGSLTYYNFRQGATTNTHLITLPDGPENHKRLQITPEGAVKMVSQGSKGSWVSFTITEANNSNLVHIKKRNATGFAIDGMGGGVNGQNIHLWGANQNNANQQWIEIDRGNGYYSYQKQGTNFCIDGGRDGANKQNVFLWQCGNNNQNQHWQKVATSGGAYKLIKRNASGYALNGGSNGTNGQNVNLFNSSNTSQNLQWIITPVGAAKASELPENKTITILPNPVTNAITIQSAEGAVLRIYDIHGKEVLIQNIVSNKQSIDMSTFAKGLYYIKINESTTVTTQKIIKN